MGDLPLKRVRQDKSNTNGARKHFHKPRKQGTQITSCLNLDSWCLESAFKTSLWWRSIRHNILSTTCVWSASDRHAVNKPHIYIFSRGFFFELCRIMELNLPMLGISQSSFPFSFPKLISFWPESIFPVLQNRLSCGSVLCTPNSLVYQLCHVYLTKASGYRAADWDVLRPPNEATNQLLLCRAHHIHSFAWVLRPSVTLQVFIFIFLSAMRKEYWHLQLKLSSCFSCYFYRVYTIPQKVLLFCERFVKIVT